MSDIRFALRMLWKRPGLAVVVILTMGLAIGANTAVFSIVDAVLLTSLPYAEPERLVYLAARTDEGYDISVSIPNYRSWQGSARAFESMGLFRITSVNLTGEAEPERLETAQVLGELFATLGRSPLLGRFLVEEETRRGAERLAVLGYGLWQRRFGAGRDVIGRVIHLDGQPFSIIGVMPEDFFFPGRETDIWVPMGVYAETLPWDDRGSSAGSYVVARLSPRATLAQARLDLESVGRQVRQDTGWRGTPTLQSLRERAVGRVELALGVLSGAVGFVLLIACANVASLLLARSEERQREIAVRRALGAGPTRLLRQLLTESLLMGIAGGLFGLVLAQWGARALMTALPDGVVLLSPVSVNANVLTFMLSVSVLSGLVFGLAPALKARRVDFQGHLKEGARGARTGSGRSSLQALLVVGEVALALLLLAGAGLLIQSFARLRAVDPGFEGADVVTMRVSLPPEAYRGLPHWYGLYRRLLERVEILPGVRSAALNNLIPLLEGGTESGALPDSRPLSFESVTSCLFQTVSPGYFRTLGIPLLRGRSFDSRDVEGRPPVVIVDESMAREFWPGENPLGRRVAFEFRGDGVDPEPLWREVVGVVGHVRHYTLRAPSRVQLYVPYTQPPIWFENRRPPLAVFVQTEVEPAGIVASVREELRALDPDLPLYDVRTMGEILSEKVGTDRMLSRVLSLFSAMALLLASVGIHGLLTYSVSRRTQEIGVRMALGARRGTVLWLVLGRSLRLAGAGVCVGLLLAVLLGRVLTSVLFQVSPADPVTLGAVAGALLLVALGASWFPARRAVRVDPGTALRHE